MANLNLQFRRHLAICVLLLLMTEFHSIRRQKSMNLAHQHRSKLAAAASAGPQPQSNQFGAPGQQRQRLQTQQQPDNNLPANDFKRDYYTMTDDDDDFNIITYALEFIGYYLPTLRWDVAIIEKQFDNQQLDVVVENYYRQNFAANATLDQLTLDAIKAAIRTAPMPIHMSWGYQSRIDAKRASLPVQDDERCKAHLSQLVNRLDRITSATTSASGGGGGGGGGLAGPGPANALVDQAAAAMLEMPVKAAAYEATPVENFEAAQLYKSTDLHFLRYLDTFGRVPSDLLRGNVKWYGSYQGCLDTRLRANPQLGGTKRMKFRYCMAAIKSVAWPATTSKAKQLALTDDKNTHGVHSKDISLENFFIRAGACLPESCDSTALDYQENWHNIEKLIKFNLMKPFNSDHYYLSDLYCVPDLRSPLRSIPILGWLLILGTLGWLGLIGLATMVQLNVEKFYTRAVKEIRRKQTRTKRLLEASKRRANSDGGSNNSSSGGDLIEASNLSEEDEANEDSKNEFSESDILQLKHYWIRLNVYVWDVSKTAIKGVDLIQCLSLYSNWLKYTSKLKLAIVELHAEQERRERITKRNLALVESARIKALNKNAARNNNDISNLSNQQQQASGGNLTTPAAGSKGAKEANNASFDMEMSKRLKSRDDLDEFDSDHVKRRVDTSSLNALKVIALFWIIAGHCVFYLGSNISNGAILINYVRDLAGFALANGALYIVELFFVITGCLTTYLSFKYNTFRAEPKTTTSDEVELLETANNDKVGTRNRKRTSSNVSELNNNDNENLKPAYLESRMFKLPFWIMISANRYLRIAPTYLVVYAYVKLISVYVGGHGQVWDYAVSPNSMRRSCKEESWLSVLTLTTNFGDLYGHCIVGGWYLSVDFQFMLMAIPVLIVLAKCMTKKDTNSGGGSLNDNINKSSSQQFTVFTKNQQQLTITTSGQVSTGSPFNNKNEIVINTSRLLFGYSMVLALGLISLLASIIYGILMSEVDLTYILKFVPHTVALLSRNIAMYSNSIFRFRAFAFGLILGHLLYLYEFKLIRLPKIIQQHGSKLTTVVFSAGFCIMFVPIIYPQSKMIFSHDIVAILMILAASGIDIFLCILIFLVCIGKAPKFVLFFLNSPFWTVLSSLSLCAFLVHMEVIILLTSQLNPPPTAQYSLLLFVFSATLIITYILALGLYLSFEMPMSHLIESVMRKMFSSSKVVRSDNNAPEAN